MYGCIGPNAGNWTYLHRSMDLSDRSGCEILCKQKDGAGCCYLSNKTGCSWREGAVVGRGTINHESIAITCSGTYISINIQGVFFYQTYAIHYRDFLS